MIIDLHAHMLDTESVDTMRHEVPRFAPALLREDGALFLDYPDRARMGPVPSAMVDVTDRLAAMDQQEVDVQVLALPPSQYFYDVPSDVAVRFAELQNDGLARIATEAPDRFHVFACLPLQDPEASVREIARLAGSPSVRGVQIGTHVADRNLDDPALEPVWAALAAADLPVWLHPDQRGVAGESRLRSYYLVNLIGNPLESTIALASLVLGGVLERHPTLRIGVVHGGGFTPYQTGRWDHGYGQRAEARTRLATPPSEHLGRVFYDSLTHDATALAFLLQRVGVAQVVLGSDHPFDMASPDPVGAVRRLGLPEQDEQAILQHNARRFLRQVPAGAS